MTVIFFLISAPLSAQIVDEIEHDDNNGEVMSLFEIERLIRRTDYTEALKQLNIYIEKKPDYFDNAQRLVKIIMNRRKQYSVLAEKAIKSSTDNPEDHETPAKIILQMRSLEKNPPAEIKRMIDMLEEMHLFKYYAYLYDAIIDQSAELSNKGNYSQAIAQVRADGFDIYKDEYYDTFETLEPKMIEDSEAIVAKLDQTIAQLEDPALLKEFESLNTQFLRALNSDDYETAAALFPSLQQSYRQYSNLRNSIYNCGQDVKNLYAKQKEIDPEVTDASYLPFIQRFILGASDPANSGILGAVDARFNHNVENLKLAIEKNMNTHSQSYLAVLPEDVLGDGLDYTIISDKAAYVSVLQKYTSIGKSVNGLYGLLSTGSEEVFAPYPSYDISLEYESSLADATASLMQKTSQFKIEQTTQKSILGSENPDVSQLFDSVFRMSTILGEKNSLEIHSFPWGSNYQSVTEGGEGEVPAGYMDWSEHSTRYTAYLDRLFQVSAESMTDSWSIITMSYRQDADQYLKEVSRFSKYAEIYSGGFDEHLDTSVYNQVSGNPEKLVDYVSQNWNGKEGIYHYPELSVVLYNHSAALSESYIAELTQKQQSLNDNLNAHPDWLENDSLVMVVNAAVDYMQGRKSELELNRLKAIQSGDDKRLVLEEAAYNQSYADSILEESRAALARGDLAQAERLLLEASEKYSESLAIADNASLRRNSDSTVAELSVRIMDAKNEIVIRESREMYTQAREALNYDRYEDSETLINAAINKWAETHTEKNPEFEDFLELVNTAVSMKTGRVLIASDPLYSEMSQLLSIAYQYYDEGVYYTNMGNQKEANASLESAVENLNKFKAVYPLNQEASLLLLKIDRLRDPAKFDEEFAQKVQTAINQSKKKDTMAQAYNTLTDYYNLEPDYKGLKDVIYNLEIELGMRQRPVDNSAAARSTRLTTQARNQFNSAGSNISRLNKALETVNEALRLNPNNTEAANLKDRISLKIGSSSIIVLSSDDQNLLTQAKKAYQVGNVDEANTYMLRLLNNNPNNIKLKEVEELYNKINSQL